MQELAIICFNLKKEKIQNSPKVSACKGFCFGPAKKKEKAWEPGMEK